MVFFMATGHPLAQQDQLTLADCSQIDYVSAVDKASDIFYNAYLKPAGIEPKSFTTITQGQSLMNLVAAGHGQAILPRFVIKEMLAGGKLKSVAIADAIPTPSSWFVAHRENQDLSDYAKAFVALVREFMKTYLA
jgi:LysR family transcriptional regulator for metE and metH